MIEINFMNPSTQRLSLQDRYVLDKLILKTTENEIWREYRQIEIQGNQMCKAWNKPFNPYTLGDVASVKSQIDNFKKKISRLPWNRKNLARISKISKIESGLNKIAESKITPSTKDYSIPSKDNYLAA